MMKNLVKVIFCMILFMSFNQISVKAESAGGQVSSKSGITFYQSEEPPTKESKPTPNPKDKTGSNDKTFLPKTGEQKGNGTFYGWGFVLMAFVGWILLKRRRKYEK